MFSAIIWNVRGIGCTSTRLRVKNLCRIHNIPLLVLLEPLIANDKLLSTAKFLGFKHSVSNVFWKDYVRVDIIGDFTQVMHYNIELFNYQCCASFVYTATSRHTRQILWEQLSHFHTLCILPWFVGGDFNTISNPSERLGGASQIYQSMEDFNNVIMDCNLLDIGFSGDRFTWHRGHLWQRLDRVLFNDLWINSCESTNVFHLSRTLSDHSPLLINIKPMQLNFLAQFRFQNMWMLHDNFMEVVKTNWLAPIYPNNTISGMKRLWLKLKRLKTVLKWWNHHVFKNLFTNILNAEDKVNNFEKQCQLLPSEDNFILLREAKVILSNLQAQEEIFWKQKAAVKHLVEGDNNTKYFHALVKRKRAINRIQKINREDGSSSENETEIVELAVHYFQNLLTNLLVLRYLLILILFLHFEFVSGLALNKHKCFFIPTKKVPLSRIRDIKILTGFSQGFLPLKYLGVPLFKGRKKSFLFDDLISSLQKRFLYWDSNFLSFGGRLTLIKSVLCSIPIYSFQTLFPFQVVCNRINRLINRFFWKGASNNSKILWASWDNCCGVLEEGALGCKSMHDLAYSFSVML
ncbi:hypothetical protein M5K25_000257 [Dendrobium thyrsiflorum]|uniref:Endonuclease/exonuclease/phosphatase domain-containing protein n=1 Tax=Dendrobium thyrsiflorum TaxID=117978 RepID=A0ABD0VTE9_DENTH